MKLLPAIIVGLSLTLISPIYAEGEAPKKEEKKKEKKEKKEITPEMRAHKTAIKAIKSKIKAGDLTKEAGLEEIKKLNAEFKKGMNKKETEAPAEK